jgi:hypothetical protein
MTSPQRTSAPAQKPVERNADADWEHSEALTSLIPQPAHLAPPAPPVPVGPPIRRQQALVATQIQQLELPAPAVVVADKAPPNNVRRAIVVLGVVLLGVVMVRALRPAAPSARRSLASAALAAASSPAPVVELQPKTRPVIEARSVDVPKAKDAAAAFARGDYREALAQYRGLAQQQPDQPAYRSLIGILERRLAPKTPGN